MSSRCGKPRWVLALWFIACLSIQGCNALGEGEGEGQALPQEVGPDGKPLAPLLQPLDYTVKPVPFGSPEKAAELLKEMSRKWYGIICELSTALCFYVLN